MDVCSNISIYLLQYLCAKVHIIFQKRCIWAVKLTKCKQNQTKEQKGEKSLKSFVISHILCTFVLDNEPLIKAGGSASGVL